MATTPRRDPFKRIPRRGFKLRDTHLLLLKQVASFVLATNQQLNDSLYAPGMLSTTEDRLLELFDQGYVARVEFKRGTHGNPKVVNTLDTKGVHVLRGLGYQPIRPSLQTVKKSDKLAHAVDTSQVLSMAAKLSRLDHSIHLRATPEPFLRRKKLEMGIGVTMEYTIPDIWLQFVKVKGDGDWGEAVLCIEVDRDTEPVNKAVNEKISRYLRSHHTGGYQRLVGLDRMEVAWVATVGGIRRREELLRAATNYLTNEGLEEYAPLFYFGYLEPQESPGHLFFGLDNFRQVGVEGSVSLLPVAWRSMNGGGTP